MKKREKCKNKGYQTSIKAVFPAESSLQTSPDHHHPNNQKQDW